MRGFLRRPGPSRRRAAFAAGAGLLGDLLLLAALWAAGAALSQAAHPLGGGSARLGVLLAAGVLVAAIAGGTLPALALGTGRGRGLASSLVGHVCAAAVVLGAMVPLRPFDGWPAYLGVELSLAVTIAGAFWVAGGARRRTIVAGGVLSIASLTLGGFFYGILSSVVGLLAWVLLPALASLLAGRRSRSA